MLRKVKTKKGKVRWWLDFVSDHRHQKKFQLLEDACEYLYLNWFCYKINNRSVNDDAVFNNASLKEMLNVFYGYQVNKFNHNEIAYNTVLRYKLMLNVNIDIKLQYVTPALFENTSAGVRRSFKTFFQWLIDYKLININPIKIKKYTYKLPYVANRDDIKQINNNPDLTDQDKLLIYIAQHTGARISEIVTLRINNMTDKTITFITHEVKGVEKLQTKSGIGRTIRVNAAIIKKIKSLYTPNPNTYVFWNLKRKKRITVSAFRQKFKRKSHLTCFHSLRHRVASEWIQEGVDLTRISKALGHHSITYTFKKYAHLIYANYEMPMVD